VSPYIEGTSSKFADCDGEERIAEPILESPNNRQLPLLSPDDGVAFTNPLSELSGGPGNFLILLHTEVDDRIVLRQTR
jgi:hypothetical protein